MFDKLIEKVKSGVDLTLENGVELYNLDIFTLGELEKEFTLERVNKSSSIFDLQKLKHLNQQHILGLDAKELAKELKPEMDELGFDTGTDEYFASVVALLKTRLHFRKDFVDWSRYFFKDPESFDPKVVKKRWKDDSVKLVLEFCEEISNTYL